MSAKIYVGPSVEGLMQNTVFTAGVVPTSQQALVDSSEDIQLLIVDLADVVGTVAATRTPGSPEYDAYARLAGEALEPGKQQPASPHAQGPVDNVARNDIKQRAANVTLAPYNAKGDGTTDDAAAIQNALDNNSRVFIPKLNYFLGSLVTIPEGCEVICYGAKFVHTGSNIKIVACRSHTRLRGIEIVGNGRVGLETADLEGMAIEVMGASAADRVTDVKIENCKIRDLSGYGIRLEFVDGVEINKTEINGVGYSGVQCESVSNVTVDGCKIKDIAPGKVSSVNGSIIGYGVAFTNKAIDDETLYPRSRDCTVKYSTVEDNLSWEALDTHGGENIQFLYNRLINNNTGIAMVPVAVSIGGSTVKTRAPQNCKAIGNVIVGVGGVGFGITLNGAGSADPAAPVEYAKNCVIDDNDISNCGENGNSIGSAMYVRETIGARVSNNNLHEVFANGINLYLSNIGFNVFGNTVTDVQDSTYATPAAIVVRADENYGYIGGNSLNRSNPTLNTYVAVRGVSFHTNSTSVKVDMGANKNTCQVPLYNAVGTKVSFGDLGNGGKRYVGSGSPSGVIIAPVGSEYWDTFNKAKYVKDSGTDTDSNGWTQLNKQLGTKIFDSGDIYKNACYYDGANTVHIPKMFIRISSTNLLYKNYQTFTFDPAFLQIGGARAIGVLVDTSKSKSYVVRKEVMTGFPGRLMLQCFDAIGNVLTEPGANAPYAVSKSSASLFYEAATYGGVYRIGVDTEADISFTVGDDVKSIQLMINNGTAVTKIKRLVVESLDPVMSKAYVPYDEVMSGVSLATAPPTAGTWPKGKVLLNDNKSELGTAGSKYIIDSWECVVAGTPGTWIEKRYLTGN